MWDNHRTMQMALLALGAALSVLAAAPPSAHAGPRGTSSHSHDAYTIVARADAGVGAEMIGKPAPAWSFDRWLRSAPLSLDALRGKVVLVRWWTDGCPYCEATLPGLETLRQRYAGRGLVVIGVYHPKPPRAIQDRRITRASTRLGFEGPLAVDERWSTLDRYWLGGHPERGWTSVSFLIDRAGNVRWLHGGGEYHPSSDSTHAACDLEYQGLEKMVTTLLAAPASASR
jgi:thiol-disulfide isomerase/thioredoxin